MSEPPISSSETDEQLDLEGWRKKLEDERIEKYLSDLNKHVHHVRIPVGAKTIGVRQRPTPRQFKFVQPSTQTAASLESDQPDDNVEQVDGEITNGAQLHSLTGKWSVMEVDWLKFGIAYLQYLLNPSITALTPFEPFSIPRLRSNTTRLYTAARPGLERFGSIVARVCLWESRLTTSTVVVIYSILVMTGTLLPALLLLPLYPLLSYRFFPPSPQVLHQEAAEATRRSQQVDEIVNELAEDNDLDAKVEDSPSSEQGRPSRRAGQGLGIGIDLSKVHGIRNEVEELTGADLSGAQKKGSKGKSKKTRLRAWKKHVEEEYGAGIVVVVGDLADCAEKLKNLYLWCSPSVSTTFAVGLVCTSALTYFAPLWLLVKLFQVAIGVVAFVVVPLIAAQEQYEPMSWLFGTAPTDAEYAIELLRQRAAAGVPLVIPRKSSSLDTRSINSEVSSYASSVRTPPPLPTRDRFKQGLQKVGNQGLDLLDTSRQIASGDREVKFSFRPSDTASIATTSSGSSSQRFNIGKKGPGITVAPKAGLEDATVSTFFAQHKRGPGILTISPEAISFKALLPQKEKVVLDTPDGPVPTETKWKGVEIPFRDVIGVKRTDKTSFFVVLASGLQIESRDGIIVSFPIVSNRDQAFQLLLSFVDRQLAKV